MNRECSKEPPFPAEWILPADKIACRQDRTQACSLASHPTIKIVAEAARLFPACLNNRSYPRPCKTVS